MTTFMNIQIGQTEKELMEARKKKLDLLQDSGVNPYPSKSNRDHTCQSVRDKKDDLVDKNIEVTVAGRIMAQRGHGKLVFLDLEDESGKIQIVLKCDKIKEDDFKLVSLLDLGDFAEVAGSIFMTKSGELSIEAHDLRILVKSIRPLPEKYYGLKDTETRYRERYADLLVNPEVKSKFYIRSKIIQSLRTYLLENNFIEVETPVLQSIPGGASAKPFCTHYNAYDRDVFLRVAPELYLKRLLVGGYERVFEFARCFRNEGVDATHNPEFTNLEFYWAYSDYEKLMDFTEDLIKNTVRAINNDILIMEIEGKKIDFGKKFNRVTFKEATLGKNTDKALKVAVAEIVEPTFITNHPTSLIPLAKRSEKNPDVVDSFQLVIAGVELIKAFSELNDPIDQRKRFEEQMALREAGDEEAQILDEDFLKAIEYGMPPTAGWGLGIDRLTRILTNSKTLREILFFPFMKPE